jgi:gamma-glutamylcyclotransferase (GGCT)/AIG2-like uncharacterized protein YtfP
MSKGDKGTLVFVYGSLRAGMGNHSLLAGASPFGGACTNRRYALVHFGVPAIVPDSRKGRLIRGEVYSCPKPVLTAVRLLEEAYDQVCDWVTLDSGEQVECEYYQMATKGYGRGETAQRGRNGLWTELACHPVGD